jgi:glycosyltransferase involved in cell wall biosynthesis
VTGTAAESPMLRAITPVILTNNEAHNIGRTLSNLDWAREIVVVDSGSTDETLRIVESHPRVRLFRHPLETHCKQWEFATQQTGISKGWILRLDADYQIPPGLVEEISQLDPEGDANAYRIGFDYAVFSKTLLATLYPANTILLKVGRFAVRDEGHTEAWTIDGSVIALKSRAVHDDWKSMSEWLPRQAGYMQRELEKLQQRRTGLRDWLRMRPPLMPIIVFFYCLFGKGLIFNGKAGLLYTLQRTIAETMLSLLIVERKIRFGRVSGNGKEEHG